MRPVSIAVYPLACLVAAWITGCATERLDAVAPGGVNLTGSTVTSSWLSMGHDTAYYHADGSNNRATIQTDLVNMAADCTAAWDATIDFTPFIGVNIVLNSDDREKPACDLNEFSIINGRRRNTQLQDSSNLPPHSARDSGPCVSIEQ